jgi:hypothetical protein
MGQAFRAKYLDKALQYIASHEGVWLTTSDEIAEHYVRNVVQSDAAGRRHAPLSA